MGNHRELYRTAANPTFGTAWDLVGRHGADAFVVAALWMSSTIDAGDDRRAKALLPVIEALSDMRAERLSGHVAPAC